MKSKRESKTTFGEATNDNKKKYRSRKASTRHWRNRRKQPENRIGKRNTAKHDEKESKHRKGGRGQTSEYTLQFTEPKRKQHEKESMHPGR